MSRVVNVSSAGGPLDILRLLCSQMDLAVTLQFALAFAGFVSASKCPSPSPRRSNISSELLTCDGRDAEKGAVQCGLYTVCRLHLRVGSETHTIATLLVFSQTLSRPCSFPIVCSIACTLAEPFAHRGSLLRSSIRMLLSSCSCCVLQLCMSSTLATIRADECYQPDTDGPRDCAYSWLPLVSCTLVKLCYRV